MISNLHLRNFRAFKKANLDFGKLNIFVGPNNSGKSSLISALNVIAQTVRTPQRTTPLLLNGEFDELGAFQDVVHGHGSRTRIEIGITINNYKYLWKYKYRTQRRETELIGAEIHDKGETLTTFLSTKSGRERTVGTFDQTYLSQFRRAGLFQPTGIFSAFNAPRPFYSEKPYTKSESKQLDLYRHYLHRIIRAQTRLERSFKYFDSLSPFRAPPQRTYMYTGESPDKIGSQGQNAINILANDSSKRGKSKGKIEVTISDWFNNAGIANNIDVVTLTPRHFEVCTVDKMGKRHNLKDSGFGCSQVIPVLAGGLNLSISEKRNHTATFCVQEPEIHLHPNAQAMLGSFFADLAQQNVQCFIETHSDSLIVRIARRVASGDIDAKDVRLFWVSSNEEGANATPMNIERDGSLPSNWPGGFFPTRSSETMELAKTIMQKKNRT